MFGLLWFCRKISGSAFRSNSCMIADAIPQNALNKFANQTRFHEPCKFHVSISILSPKLLQLRGLKKNLTCRSNSLISMHCFLQITTILFQMLPYFAQSYWKFVKLQQRIQMNVFKVRQYPVSFQNSKMTTANE